MSTFQPPPTWALPVNVDEKTGKSAFSPIWLKWFVDLAKVLSSSGFSASGGLVHNGLEGLQGGAGGQYYHISYADYLAISNTTSLTGGTATQVLHGASSGWSAVDLANDVAGTLSETHLGGLSVTITTAKLTALGANGSMTFTNGLLTAQTAAT